MVIYWPPWLLSENNLISDLSFLPLMLEINAVYLAVDDKIKIGILLLSCN